MKPHDLDANVVVQMVRASESQAALERFEPWLSPAERERAARFRFPEDRARFILGRGLVRENLGRYLSKAPESIELPATDRGRPFLEGSKIAFSITHTQDLVAVALTANARVGIDIEVMQPKVNLSELAERILSEKDFRAFEALPETGKLPAFFRVWTRKEAYLKARSEGIAEGLQKISVSFGPDDITLVSDARDEANAPNWRLHTLPVPADYMGCVACDDAGNRIKGIVVCSLSG